MSWEPSANEPGHFALPRDPPSYPVANIANNTFYYALIRGSTKVDTVRFHLPYVSLRTDDHLAFPFPSNPADYTDINLNQVWTTSWASEGGSSSPWSGHINFSTNSQDPPGGFSIDAIDVTCKAESQAVASTEAWVEKKNIGFLTQTGDTVYYSYPAPATNLSTNQPYHLHVALNNDSPGTRDFDLYARCGAYPTASEYDFIGYSSSAQEFIDISTTCASQWFFAVNSYSGSGLFDLTVGEGDDQNECIAFDPAAGYTTAQKTVIRDQIVAAMSGFYGATLGGLFLNRITFLDGDLRTECQPGDPAEGLPERPVDIVVQDACDGTVTAGNAGQIALAIPKNPAGCTGIQWNSTSFMYVLPHELSHNKFQLPDEYQDQAACGHSLMDSLTWSNIISYCTAANHARDPNPGQDKFIDPSNHDESTTPFGDSVSMWERMAENYYNRPINFRIVSGSSSPRMLPHNTPENYSFRDFDFNTYLTHVTVVTQYN